MECNHRWRKVYEEVLFLGPGLIGYRCIDCNKFVSTSELTPIGIGGILLHEYELVGPGQCSNGSPYKRQIISNNGHTLTIERPDGKIEVRDI
jgi:hypothetical protein